MNIISFAYPRFANCRDRLGKGFRYGSTFADSIQGLLGQAKNGAFCNDSWFADTQKKTVTLLHPPGACSAFTRSGSQYPPLGLLQLKSVIGDTNRVDVLEADGFGWSNEETVHEIKKDPPLAVGMTVLAATSRLE